jgi:hypothetical protein
MEKGYSTQITKKLNCYFYKIKEGSSPTFKKGKPQKVEFYNLYDSSTLTMQMVIKDKQVLRKLDKPFLIHNKAFLSRGQRKLFSIMYKIERWFRKHLSSETYNAIHDQTTFLIYDFMKIQNLPDFLKEQNFDQNLKKILIELIAKYRDKKKAKNLTLELLSASPSYTEFMNEICGTYTIQRENYRYNLVTQKGTNVNQVKQNIEAILNKYNINKTNTDYRWIEE